MHRFRVTKTNAQGNLTFAPPAMVGKRNQFPFCDLRIEF